MAKKDEKLMMIERENVDVEGFNGFAYKIMVKNPNEDWSMIYNTIGKYEDVPYPPFKIAWINADMVSVLNNAARMGYKLVN